MKQTAKVVRELRKTKSLSERLREMNVGEEVMVRSSEYHIAYVRNAAYRLSKENRKYDVSEKGMINECRITRIR